MLLSDLMEAIFSLTPALITAPIDLFVIKQIVLSLVCKRLGMYTHILIIADELSGLTDIIMPLI